MAAVPPFAHPLVETRGLRSHLVILLGTNHNGYSLEYSPYCEKFRRRDILLHEMLFLNQPAVARLHQHQCFVANFFNACRVI